MTEANYPHDTLIRLTPNVDLNNNMSYTLPPPTDGLKYTWVLSANAGTNVIIGFGYTSDIVSGFLHTTDDDLLGGNTGIGSVVINSGQGNRADKIEFFSDGVEWFFEIHHFGIQSEISYTSNS
jgi:hypothetical protein